ncbi:hypothetical protein PV04_08310 [Phialophora macrospora]|uniref:protein-tyrosine-phosphatase n=1 Tax=Phialophora macrospora TaxID=1851006 RepID=A0A0D2CLJ3_9EURO|nr:hypothetical protein PV04_08310 [Phialophora macrospora]
MSDLKTPTIVPIKAIPGLFIADRFAASSRQQLQGHNIVRIVSVLQRHETSRSINPHIVDAEVDADSGEAGHPARSGPEIRVLELDDDPLVDILQWLEETCDWIQEGLDRRNVDVEESSDRASDALPPGVLVHLMRRLQISYASALSLARESRPQITPNSGFERQLRVWEFCRYSVYDDDGRDGSVESGRVNNERREKPSYKAWKAERDNLLKKGEEHVNRARFSSLADMAARFGRRRQDDREGEGEVGRSRQNDVENDEGLEKSLGQDKRREAWERVQKMEREWNERLIRGQVQGQSQ